MTGNVRVVDLSSPQFSGYRDSGGGRLDPALLIGTLPGELLSLSDSLFVKIWDDKSSVIYRYNTFISKTYRVEDGFIKFGVKKLQLAGMTLVVGIKIDCEDLDSLALSVD